MDLALVIGECDDVDSGDGGDCVTVDLLVGEDVEIAVGVLLRLLRG